MKSNLFHSFFVIFTLLLLLTSGCKNPCKYVDCGHGTCNRDDTSCDCEPDWVKDSQGKCTIKNICYQKDCLHGTCDATLGKCLCDFGYETNTEGFCAIEMRTKFIGNWQAIEFCNTSTSYSYYFQIVENSSGIDQIILKDFCKYCLSGNGLQVNASISGNTINIPYQEINFNGDNIIFQAATGTLKGNLIEMEYTMSLNGVSETCGVQYYKQ